MRISATRGATDEDIVEAILDQLRESGARLCDIQFYSSIVPTAP
jgi:hypothetical protein